MFKKATLTILTAILAFSTAEYAQASAYADGVVSGILQTRRTIRSELVKQRANVGEWVSIGMLPSINGCANVTPSFDLREDTLRELITKGGVTRGFDSDLDFMEFLKHKSGDADEARAWDFIKKADNSKSKPYDMRLRLELYHPSYDNALSIAQFDDMLIRHLPRGLYELSRTLQRNPEKMNNPESWILTVRNIETALTFQVKLKYLPNKTF